MIFLILDVPLQYLINSFYSIHMPAWYHDYEKLDMGVRQSTPNSATWYQGFNSSAFLFFKLQNGEANPAFKVKVEIYSPGSTRLLMV